MKHVMLNHFPMSHDKKFQNCVRLTLSRVCRCVALDFTTVSIMSIFTHVYPFYRLRCKNLVHRESKKVSWFMFF